MRHTILPADFAQIGTETAILSVASSRHRSFQAMGFHNTLQELLLWNEIDECPCGVQAVTQILLFTCS